jgi:hypothetical protein
VQVAPLAQRNQSFHVRTRSLRLGDGGLNAILKNDGGDQIAQHGAAMTGVPSKFDSSFTMTHDESLFLIDL